VSQDRPDAHEVLRTVREFVDSMRPKLAGEDQFHAIVASFLLSVVEREMRLAPVFDAREHRELADFTGSEAPLPELQRTLCEGIRAGRYDARFDELLAIVLEQTANKVRVVRPDHLDPGNREASDK
jgi:hypothetical protein